MGRCIFYPNSIFTCLKVIKVNTYSLYPPPITDTTLLTLTFNKPFPRLYCTTDMDALDTKFESYFKI